MLVTGISLAFLQLIESERARGYAILDDYPKVMNTEYRHTILVKMAGNVGVQRSTYSPRIGGPSASCGQL
jgi:hypothetical protein